MPLQVADSLISGLHTYAGKKSPSKLSEHLGSVLESPITSKKGCLK